MGESFGQVSANTGTRRKVFAKVKGKGRAVCHIAGPGGGKGRLERMNSYRAVVP